MAILMFDIDGTLVDTTEQMTVSIHRSMDGLEHLGLPSEELVRSSYGLAGNAFWENIFPEANLEEIRQIRRTRHAHLEQAMEGKDVLFGGMRETLERLREEGHILTTASNCGVHYLNLILDSQGIREFFTSPKCLESVSGKKKADILAAHKAEFGEAAYVMIGDRMSDVEAARAHGMTSVICRYGFGTRQEWDAADVRIESPSDLIGLY